MDEQLRMQDGVAQALERAARTSTARSSFETHRSRARLRRRHAARGASRRRRIARRQLIENLMVAANGVTARFLDARGFPSLRRVVKSPERWDRIRARRAESSATSCRPTPDSDGAARRFWRSASRPSPDTFPDLSHHDHPAARLAASTSSIRRARSRRAISGSRCATTRTRRRRTGAFRISSRSGW